MSKISELSDGGVIQGGDTLIAVRSGGNVKVTYGGSTTANIDGGTIDGTTIGGTTPAAGNFTTGSFTGDVTFADNIALRFGSATNGDLVIKHDGSDSSIVDRGDGDLLIQGSTNVKLQNFTGSKDYFVGSNGGASTVYYDGSAKLATTSTGIDVTGTVVADGLTVDAAQSNFNDSAGSVIAFQKSASAKAWISNRSYSFHNGNGLAINTTDANPIIFGTNNAERLRIDSSGNVGIGTTNPDRAIKIEKDNAYVWIADAEGGNVGFIGGSGSNDGLLRLYEGAGHTAKVEIHSDADSYFNGGNVGIGTDSPSTILHAKSASPKLLLQDSSQTGRQTQLTQAAGIAKIRSRNNASNGQIVFEGYTASTTSEYMRIDSSGNVGIGTSSPSADLHIEGSAPYLRTKNTSAPTDEKTWDYNAGTDGTFRFRATNDAGNDSNNWMVVDRSGVDINYIAMSTGNQDEAMRITNAGDVEVKSGGKLQANRADNARNIQLFNDSDFGTIQTSNDPIKIASQAYTRFDVGGTERLRIDASGNLLVGTTSTTPTGGGILLFRDATRGILRAGSSLTSADAVADFHNPNGKVGQIVISGSSTAYQTSSDHRLKENVVAMTGATERLKQLAPKRFNFIADSDTTVDGFLAHEVADVVPEAITGAKDAVDDDGNAVYQGIDQSKLVPLLVATIQELEARIAALESN